MAGGLCVVLAGRETGWDARGYESWVCRILDALSDESAAGDSRAFFRGGMGGAGNLAGAGGIATPTKELAGKADQGPRDAGKDFIGWGVSSGPEHLMEGVVHLFGRGGHAAVDPPRQKRH